MRAHPIASPLEIRPCDLSLIGPCTTERQSATGAATPSTWYKELRWTSSVALRGVGVAGPWGVLCGGAGCGHGYDDPARCARTGT